MSVSYELLYSDVPLSFWGGIDYTTGLVIDQTHPLYGQCVTDKVLCLPCSRGSCTGSQVMLELILHGTGPSAIILRDVDPIICCGVIVADIFFRENDGMHLPTVYAVGEEVFNSLRSEVRIKLHAMNESDGIHEYIIRESVDQIVRVQDLIKIPPLPMKDYRKDIEKQTEAYELCLLTVCRIGAIQNAPALIPVTSAHIDGVTLIGKGGLRFARRLVELGGRVAVPTTLNSGSVDRRRWNEIGIETVFATNACDLGDAYLKLGASNSFTCAPYLLPSRPNFGEDIMWGESNAVVFANSVVGARTEKYPDYFDICASIVGMVPLVGVHLNENRMPTIVIDATKLISECSLDADDVDMMFPTIGWICGLLSGSNIPIVIGLEKLSFDDTKLKAFCASFGTTGTAPLCHIAGVTPEADSVDLVKEMVRSAERIIHLSKSDVVHALDALDSGKKSMTSSEKVDLISLGNPHLSVSELELLVQLTKSDINARKSEDIRMIGTLSRFVYDEGKKLGYVDKLEAFGMEFINDTCWCMLLDPPVIPSNNDGVILTNSGKYAHYGPGLTNRRFRFGSWKTCIDVAKTGRLYNTKQPSWLLSTTKRSLFNIAKRLPH